MKVRGCVFALILLGGAYAKDKDLADYPINVLVVQAQAGNFSYGCIMDIIDAHGNMQYQISSNGMCTTFSAGAKLHGRIHNKMGMQLFELAWQESGKVKAKNYRIDLTKVYR